MVVWTLKRALVGLGLASSAVLAAPAQAGQYHVYSCRTPAGEVAPADGWSGSVTPAGVPDVYAKNTCAEGGALVAALGEQARTANSQVATWAFVAPMGETIANATLWRAGDADGGVAINATYEFWFAGPVNLNGPTHAFGQCAGGSECATGVGNVSQPQATENRIVVPPVDLGSNLYMNASCGGVSEYNCPVGKGDANGYAAVVNLYAADLLLEQTAGPSAYRVGGELASAPTVSGATDVTFSATDPGSGVYEAVFSVDGRVVQSTVVNDNGGHCRDVGQAPDGTAAFDYVQPCAQSVSADVPFDTARVSNGEHHLIVSVIDAAGNAAPVLDRRITVANAGAPGPPNGTNASVPATLAVRWKGTRSASLTSSFGRRQTVIGRLTGSDGAPILGALIDVQATPAYAGARSAAMASPHTGRDGRFSVRLTGGISSRTLRFAYRSNLGDVPPVATRTLTLKVRAGIALGVAPHTASVGRSIFFSGRLRGGPIPSDGKQLVLEARSPGGPWLEFKVIRTGRRGRFGASYQFKFPGPADYQFRVLSELESDYPFAAGFSNVVRVREL